MATSVWRGLVAATVLAAAGCASGGDDRRALHVFAAASLTDAFGEIEEAFEADHPDVDVVLNLGGSSSLREQILAGAPAAVFASADAASMDALVDAGEIAGTPEPFATNELELAVPGENRAGVSSLTDLARDDLLVGLCAEPVPCGDLARRVLHAAGVIPALDTEEPDARSLLTKLAEGELDVGLVYRTDVLAAGSDVRGIELPDDLSVSTAYPIATLTDDGAARDFVGFVLGDDGQGILDRFGFGAP